MSSRFYITQAVAEGYRFAGREWRYLARMATVPMFVTLLITVLVSQFGEGISTLGVFLLSIPATIASAWFMFLIARLMVLGERADNLPQDPAFRAERRRRMESCIIGWMLFNMLATAVAFYALLIHRPEAEDPSPLAVGLSLLLIGGMFWAVRLGVVHLLLAVGYPVRKYIFLVNGVGISLRLIGLCILAALPPTIAAEITGRLIHGGDIATMQDISLQMQLLVIPLSYVMTALVTASCVEALRQILSRPARRLERVA